MRDDLPDKLPALDAVVQRVLGSLLEKQATVPSSHPLSLNLLRLACNQTSQGARLLRVVWAGKGSRTPASSAVNRAVRLTSGRRPTPPSRSRSWAASTTVMPKDAGPPSAPGQVSLDDLRPILALLDAKLR